MTAVLAFGACAPSPNGGVREFRRAFEDLDRVQVEPSVMADPKTVSRLGPNDLHPIREVTIEFPKRSPSFERREPTSDDSLMRGPFLRLAGSMLSARNHVFVSTAPAQLDDETPQAWIVDLEKGPVLEVRQLAAVYPELDIVEAELDRSGARPISLVHLSDLREVQMVPAAGGNLDVVVNAALGDGWVFEIDVSYPKGARARYAHWTNLREPPPAPDRELPFQPWNPNREGTGLWGDYLTPLPGFELPVLVVARTPDSSRGCASAQMLPDGSYRCAVNTRFLGGGWRMTTRGNEIVFANDDTREVQRLDLEQCGDATGFARDDRDIDESITLYPPRVLFGCHELGPEILWSPGRIESVDRLEGGPPQRTANGWVVTDPRKDQDESPDGHGSPTRYLDLAHRKLFRTPPTFQYSTHIAGETIILAPRSQPGSMWVLDLEKEVVSHVFSAPECEYLDATYGDGRWWAVTCSDRSDRMLWSEVFDGIEKKRWRLPATNGSAANGRLWVNPRARVAFGIVRREDEDVLHIWGLE